MLDPSSLVKRGSKDRADYKNMILTGGRAGNCGENGLDFARSPRPMLYRVELDVAKKVQKTKFYIVKQKCGGETTTMDIEKREQELRAQQLVLEAFATRLAGEKDYDLEESKNLINKLIEDYKG